MENINIKKVVLIMIVSTESVLVMFLIIKLEIVQKIIDKNENKYPSWKLLKPGRKIIRTPIKHIKQERKIFLTIFSFKKIIEQIVVIIGVKKLKETAWDKGIELIAKNQNIMEIVPFPPRIKCRYKFFVLKYFTRIQS